MKTLILHPDTGIYYHLVTDRQIDTFKHYYPHWKQWTLAAPSFMSRITYSYHIWGEEEM